MVRIQHRELTDNGNPNPGLAVFPNVDHNLKNDVSIGRDKIRDRISSFGKNGQENYYTQVTS